MSHKSADTRPRSDPSFRLLHLMAVVAAVAVALSVPPAVMRAVLSRGPTHTQLQYYTCLVTLALALWTSLLATIAIVASRRHLRRAARSRGTSALLAAASGVGFLSAFLVFTTLVEYWSFSISADETLLDRLLFALGQFLLRVPEIAASTIVADWSILALGGFGREASGWLERTCKAFGWVWIAWFVAEGLSWLLPFTWLQLPMHTPL